LIDHRTPFARTEAGRLPPSATKPVQKIRAAQMQSPGYGDTKTSRLRTTRDRNAMRATASPRCRREDLIARARAEMQPEEFVMFVRRIMATLPR
jgi:hypothetical protein